MPFRFLDLPAEVRNFIFRLLLIHETPIIAYSSHNLKPPKPVSLGLSPNICLVSRVLYAESSSILYGENTFQAHPTFLANAAFAIDPERAIVSARCISMVRKWHIRVRLDCDSYYEPEDIARMFVGAEDLEIEVFRASWGVGNHDVLNAFSRIRGVTRAKVTLCFTSICLVFLNSYVALSSPHRSSTDIASFPLANIEESSRLLSRESQNNTLGFDRCYSPAPGLRAVNTQDALIALGQLANVADFEVLKSLQTSVILANWKTATIQILKYGKGGVDICSRHDLALKAIALFWYCIIQDSNGLGGALRIGSKNDFMLVFHGATALENSTLGAHEQA
ncbi:MAG: hypothetical protein Q9219_001408 [cf. Caloplaca sp. 3 TL-2023]